MKLYILVLTRHMVIFTCLLLNLVAKIGLLVDYSPRPEDDGVSFQV